MSAFPVRAVCRTMNIPRSSVYYLRSHEPKPSYDSEDAEAVRKTFLRHFGSFGRRMLHRELLKRGIKMSEHKIAGILKQQGLSSKYGRKRGKNVYTGKETSEKYVHENVYAVLTEEEKREKRIWSMDFTEERIKGRKVTTCGIKSVNGKYIVSLVPDCRNDAGAAVEAVKAGIERYGKPEMIMTDRGSPFVSRAFEELLRSEGIEHSMSRPGRPTDNGSIETLWGSMKVELGKVSGLSVKEYVQILKYYAYYYNEQRPHSTLGYCTPMEALSKAKRKNVI